MSILTINKPETLISSQELQSPLTEEQQLIHDKLLNYLLTNNNHLAALMVGYAGTGKTYTLRYLVRNYLNQASGNVGISAPTHKATKELKREQISGVTYGTIHSLLGLKEQINTETGESSFVADKFRKDPPLIEDLDVLILDEVSMLSLDIWEQLKPWIKQGLKIIFSGDPAQIPPVGEIDSIPLLKWKELGILKVELNQIMRQNDGNPILEFATEIRNNYKSGNFSPATKLDHNRHGIEVTRMLSNREKEIMESHFGSAAFEQSPDYMKVIAWRNATVDHYNRTIRSIIFKQEALPAILPGEKLIADKPYIVMDRVIIPTSEELTVLTAKVDQLELTMLDNTDKLFRYKFRVYECLVEWETLTEPVRRVVHIIHESSVTDFNMFLSAMTKIALNAAPNERNKKWRQKFAVLAKFVWVKYNYALTAHKSQGSTYDNALVLKWDIDYNGTYERIPAVRRQKIEERNRILYVACTRPRHTLFIEA